MSCGDEHSSRKISRSDGAAGGIYFFAFLGSFIYYIQHAGTFWMGVWGFCKAIAWPAILIYKLFEHLKL
ncbi:hypothetical protein KKC97_04745 [bacterium]|nr:hypothetical protein [bacterium]MBU1636957.1 hypothetical protein [bacterium]MBU1920530.1 hypothetical protein [bacterium]